MDTIRTLSLRDRTPEQRKQIIESCRTENGGWTKETLEEWGIKWPPLKGWKKQLEALGYYDSTSRLDYKKDPED